MTITCPNCQEAVPASEVFLHIRVAHCITCRRIFNPTNEQTSYNSKLLTKTDTGLQVIPPMETPKTLLANIIAGLGLLVDYVLNPGSSTLETILAQPPHRIVLIVIASYSVCHLIGNQRSIQVSKEGIRINYHPTTRPRSWIKAADIDHLYVYQLSGTLDLVQKPATVSCHIYARLKNGRKKKLLLNILGAKQALSIVEEIEKVLDL